ncbi:MAG TPA: alkaline phosphatase family protein [Gemmatimonadales bacterium]|jgi:arylsulfatase A-like enzyme
MESPQGITRVVLVVLDGLRADSAPLFPLPNLHALARRGAATFEATTVQPSITASAMTSLFTGVSPWIHGIQSDRFALPRPRQPLTFLPRLLRDHDRPVHAFIHDIPRAYRGLAARMAEHLGVTLSLHGQTAAEILDGALPQLQSPDGGVTFLHWPDADRAGHAHGWTSREYAGAARDLDASLGRLIAVLDPFDDPGTVVVAFADHGGGGRETHNHESRHPLDVTIPIVIAGGQVVTGELAPMSSLLDIPATIAWLFGIAQPANYAGRPFVEAFAMERSPAPQVALEASRAA